MDGWIEIDRERERDRIGEWGLRVKPLPPHSRAAGQKISPGMTCRIMENGQETERRKGRQILIYLSLHMCLLDFIKNLPCSPARLSHSESYPSKGPFQTTAWGVAV